MRSDLEDESKITNLQRRVAKASFDIMESEPDTVAYLHALLCQVGLPRKETDLRSFERTSGAAGMRIEAGSIFRKGKWQPAPLPYGVRPRLVMIHICGEAIRRQSREIDIGHTMNDFLVKLGIDNNGPSYAQFKNQMEALSVCRMQLGWDTEKSQGIINTQPISKFEAWFQQDNDTLGMWPGFLELSGEFYETLNAHAVPLDPRAISALQGSSLSLDVYAWLAHRLCRIGTDNGRKVYWKPLREQFGQEYKDPRDFKKKFKIALNKALAVYPDARVSSIHGGLQLFPSPPPIKKSKVVVKKLPPRGKNAGSLKVSDDALDLVKTIAQGWDRQHLLRTWEEWHKNGSMELPSDPDKAFLGWVKKYTKGKPPKNLFDEVRD